MAVTKVKPKPNTSVSLTKGGSYVDGVFQPLDTNPISSDTLQSEPDFKVDPAPPATGVPGLLGEYEAKGDQFTQDLAKRAEERDKAKTDSFQALIDSISSTEGEASRTSTEYGREGGVDDIQGELDDITNQLLQEQHGLTRKIERLKKNERGLFGGALDDEIERVEAESLSKQADLSVIGLGIQGRFDSAKAEADRAVEALVEKDKQRNELLQKIYDENKTLFDKDEQRLFETQQASREAAIADKRQNASDIYDLKIALAKAGAPRSVIASFSADEDPITVLSKVGSYLYVPPAPKELLGGLTASQRSGLNQIQDNARQDPNIKDFPAVRASYETARNAALGGSGAGDIVLMRMLAKITDPTTGVREEEFETFQAAESTLKRFGVQLTQQMWEGDRLTDEGRQQLFGQVENIYEQRKGAYDNSYAFFDNQAAGWGLPEGAVMPYYAAPVGDVAPPPLPQAQINDYMGKLQEGEIMVRSNATGEIGAIPAEEFNSALYTKI